MGNGQCDVVLFDLGGVLVRLGGVATMQELTGIETEEEVWQRWFACPWVRLFECGHCTARQFADGFVADWGLSIEPQEFLESFRRWPAGLYSGSTRLLEEVRGQVQIGCLSNTNALHWDQAVGWGLDRLFELRFLSHELGLIKPDAAVFEHVVRKLGVAPEDIVFLDDNAINVDQARNVGLSAYQARGPAEARQLLTTLNILEPPGPYQDEDAQ